MNIAFVMLSMIFCHIFADYNLQGILASMKQKSWWESNAPGSLYQYDYLCALLCHSFSWSFMIMLPIAYYQSFDIGLAFVVMLLINTVAHALIDHAKANTGIINLIIDQLAHLIQIEITILALLR